MEEWRSIFEFPTYAVSSYGQVLNIQTDRVLSRSEVQGGALRVTLFDSEGPHTRSVKNLVADAFVPRPITEHDCPVLLDGSERNLKADNIVWRTRAFAWHYKRQFADVSDIHSIGPLQDVENGEFYRDIYEAATANGLLLKDVWRCVHGVIHTIPPTDQRILLTRHVNQLYAKKVV